MHWQVSASKAIALDRPRVMAVLNITPDSFFDGGVLTDPGSAAAAAARAVAEGADVLDLGGESTRPGAARVPAGEQIARVVPALGALRRAAGAAGTVAVTIDTTLSEVARAALDAGADAINDVSGGTEDPGMLDLAAGRRAGIVLMHRLVPPARDSYSDRYESPPRYGDVVREVRAFLEGRARDAVARGVAREAIVVDPGLGFGKSVEQNLELIRRTPELVSLGFPVLSAGSRKSFVGRIGLGRDSSPRERLIPSLAISVVHWLAGAAIFRVHDVGPQGEALRAAAAAMPRVGSGRVGR